MSTSKYLEQAEAFLAETGTALEVVEDSINAVPAWAEKERSSGHPEYGIGYICTLKNKRGVWSFNFWGSIRDKEMVALAEDVKKRGHRESPEFFKLVDFVKQEAANIVPYTLHSNQTTGMMFLKNLPKTVRTLVKPDAYRVLAAISTLTEDTFEDFCSSFGYDTDSRTAVKVYEACLEQDRNIRKLFDHSEIEKLNEIM